MAETGSTELDLSACDREPIHIPGTIQPHGVLLALDCEGRIARAAGDLRALLGWEGDALGRRPNELFDTVGLELRRKSAQAEYVGARYANSGMALDVFTHRSGGEAVVELEPAPAARLTGAQVLSDLLPIVSGVAMAATVTEACAIAAAGVRRITGFDRVMIYRFLDDDTGQVIAEARSALVDSFLHHRYPASDIPKQARALYMRNPIRLIADVAYEPAPMIGGEGALDLSGALLRSVSPVHIQYLKNMGVGSSASLSLVREHGLWGLIACHHRSARTIAHEQREMCRRVAMALDQAVIKLQEEDHQREALHLTRRREELLPIIAAAETLPAGLRGNIDELRLLIPADGVAVLAGDEIVCSGVTPPQSALGYLARWALTERARGQLATHELSQLYAPASDWTSSASGLLGSVVADDPPIILLWFRAEELETVNWAGNPHEPAGQDGAGGALTPRKSFEAWAETVRGRSRRWRPNEQDAGRRIELGLAEIVRQKALAELNRRLLGEISDKDLLMREVHHRVQNSLQLVTSMLRLQEREIGDETARRQLELARERVLSVAWLHRRLWRSDDLRSIDLKSFLEELVEGLARTWSPVWRSQIAIDVAPVSLPMHESLLVALVVSELLTNAVKYAYGGEAGPLSVAAREIGDDRLAITVADRGVGMSGEERPGSFGSRLVRRLVDRLEGELEILPTTPGTSITLLLPIGSGRLQ